MNKEAVKEFFNAWSVYDRVLDLNYMFHNEIYCNVANLIKKRYAARPFSILDLGCGSARHFAAALQGCTVSCYTGYDLSDIALEEAHRNLASLGCSLDFKQEDFFEGLKTGEGKADLIFSSYALHHLISSDKERFFQLAHQRLAEQGMLLLIDVARKENEDRATYLDNYCGWIQSDWKGFPQPALDAIFEHIRQNDFPETSAVCHAIAAKAGFPRGVDVKRFLWHHVWSFDKGA